MSTLMRTQYILYSLVSFVLTCIVLYYILTGRGSRLDVAWVVEGKSLVHRPSDCPHQPIVYSFVSGGLSLRDFATRLLAIASTRQFSRMLISAHLPFSQAYLPTCMELLEQVWPYL